MISSWLKILGRTSTIIGVLLYQLFAYSRKGFREHLLKTNILIDHDKLLAQFTQVLGLQSISFSLISPVFPSAIDNHS
jgi:hypothetical protein